jgi:hypothetical protein
VFTDPARNDNSLPNSSRKKPLIYYIPINLPIPPAYKEENDYLGY